MAALESTSLFAMVTKDRGLWGKAETLEVMKARKTNLGVDYPDTLSSMASLASRFWHQTGGTRLRR